MSKMLAGVAALALIAAAAMPLTAGAAERKAGASNASTVQSDELSSHRRYWRHRHGYYRPYYRSYRYGYYRPYYRPYRYGYYGYPYYRPRPFVSFGVGPFGFVF